MLLLSLVGCVARVSKRPLLTAHPNSADMTPDAHASPKERKTLPLNTKIICRKAIWLESIPLGLKKMK